MMNFPWTYLRFLVLLWILPFGLRAASLETKVSAAVACLDAYEAHAESVNALDSLEEDLIQSLLNLLNDPRSMDSAVRAELSHYEMMRVSDSDDGRVHFFMLNQRDGGTMTTFRTVMQARFPSGRVRAFVLQNDDQDEVGDIGDYTLSIHPLPGRRNQYLALQQFAYCSSGLDHSALLFKLESRDTISKKAFFAFESRVWNILEFEFDPVAMNVCFEYTDDPNDALTNPPYHYATRLRLEGDTLLPVFEYVWEEAAANP